MIIPAAFFLLLNFSVAHNPFLFCKQVIYLFFLLSLLFFLRAYSLKNILPPLIAGISVILFTYGLLQKYLLFPMLKNEIRGGSTFLNLAFADVINKDRIFAIFAMPTLYGMVCGFLLTFILHYIFLSHGLIRWLWTALALAGSSNLILTKSFGGIISLAAAAAVYMIVSKKVNLRQIIPVVMVLILLGLIVTGMRFSEARSLEPLRLRFVHWFQATRVIAISPMLGIGQGNYAMAVPPYVYPGEVPSIFAHNFLLQFAAESGLPLALFLIFLLFLYLKKKAKKLIEPENAVFSAALMLNLLFNAADVGIYFFASGLTLVICVSQIFPSPLKKPYTSYTCLALSLIFCIFWLGIGHTDNLQKKADLLASQNQKGQALDLYRRTLSLNPYSHHALSGLANLEFSAGRFRDAEAHLNGSLALFPQSGYANYLLSQLKYQKGEYLQCLYYAKRAADANKRNSLYQKWYENTYRNLQKQMDHPGD